MAEPAEPSIPARAFALEPTSAWDVVKVSQSHRTLPLTEFTGAKPKQPGSVRFVAISDTHSRQRSSAIEVPPGDVLIHTGDFTNTGTLDEIASFAAWFDRLPHQRKVVIAGNHDLTLDGASYGETSRRFHGGCTDVAETCAKARALIEAIPRCEYLHDSGTSVDGVSIWGSPWQPEFCGWAFMLPRGQALRDKWASIPAGTDVVLTHGPPLGHGDLCSSGQRAGCLDLLHEIQTRVRPAYHIFGHIHEGHGVTTDGTTTYVNASTCTLRYRPDNPAVVFDVPSGRAGTATGE